MNSSRADKIPAPNWPPAWVAAEAECTDHGDYCKLGHWDPVVCDVATRDRLLKVEKAWGILPPEAREELLLRLYFFDARWGFDPQRPIPRRAKTKRTLLKYAAVLHELANAPRDLPESTIAWLAPELGSFGVDILTTSKDTLRSASERLRFVAERIALPDSGSRKNLVVRLIRDHLEQQTGHYHDDAVAALASAFLNHYKPAKDGRGMVDGITEDAVKKARTRRQRSGDETTTKAQRREGDIAPINK